MAQFIAVVQFIVFSFLNVSQAKEFEIFDGRNYNGKYYPRIDIIEWGRPTHMQFQVYWKDHPLEMSFQLEQKDGKNVMLVKYFIKERNEVLCRRVLAPGHFNGTFKVYKDTTDKDMDNTIVTMQEIELKPGIARLDEDKAGRTIASVKYSGKCEESGNEEETKNEPQYSGEYKNIAPPKVSSKKTKPSKSGGLKRKGSSVPFENW